jgi:hypothetical protein
MRFPNYRDFYQKLIPIGTSDFSALFSSERLPKSSDHTHWLIALEGESRTDKEYYLWKVNVYFSNSEGNFDPEKRIYSSSEFDCIHKAFEYARELEQHGKNDRLLSIYIKEKIS